MYQNKMKVFEHILDTDRAQYTCGTTCDWVTICRDKTVEED